MGGSCEQYRPSVQIKQPNDELIWVTQFWNNTTTSPCLGICSQQCTDNPLSSACRECLAALPTNSTSADLCVSDTPCIECLVDLPVNAGYKEYNRCVNGSGGLSVGAIVGIILGGIGFALIIWVAVHYGKTKTG